ncbi:hypothetical protein N7457_006428 [Penicillium paradoxum]|uniref:uncharacterized protein n=1 Tax=Penicillium paradoxum TaxID=176176 RepID=UPI002548FCA3|nr:uncharacterized protein N7457_006428 [Penicillium paradoxum]KAJ5781268.1 hypothetical protein N7457_006428 [Penicillium paradoxum]
MPRNERANDRPAPVCGPALDITPHLIPFLATLSNNSSHGLVVKRITSNDEILGSTPSTTVPPIEGLILQREVGRFDLYGVHALWKADISLVQ